MAKLTRSQARKKRHWKVRSKISGTSEIPRLNVFKSLKNIEAQLIDDVKQKTLAHSSSISLKLKNGSNIEAASKVGEDIGEKIKALKIKQVVFDRSGYIYHGRVKALAEATRKKGVKF